LVFIQPDLGTSIVLVLVVLGMLLYTNFNKIYFLILLSLFGILSAPVWNLLADYQKERILVFLNPQLDVLGAGYNVIQSLIAIGSGGIFGRGFSQGTQSHLHFLPAYWTDFAFASFAEEWGFIGVVVFFGLYTAFLFIILRVAFIVKDSFGSVLCFGVFLVFLVQFIINVGMNLGLMPVTGIPLPLVSYGGSSLLISCILLGLVQNVWTKSS
jgi:rod shape determining protein RodA